MRFGVNSGQFPRAAWILALVGRLVIRLVMWVLVGDIGLCSGGHDLLLIKKIVSG